MLSRSEAMALGWRDSAWRQRRHCAERGPGSTPERRRRAAARPAPPQRGRAERERGRQQRREAQPGAGRAGERRQRGAQRARGGRGGQRQAHALRRGRRARACGIPGAAGQPALSPVPLLVKGGGRAEGGGQSVRHLQYRCR